MDDLARDGLRTLMFAKRILSDEEANKLESKELNAEQYENNL